MDASVTYKEDRLEAHYARIENMLSMKLEQCQSALERTIVNMFEQAGSYTSVPSGVYESGFEGFEASESSPGLAMIEEDQLNNRLTLAQERMILDVTEEVKVELCDQWNPQSNRIGRKLKDGRERCCRRRYRFETIEKLEDSTKFDALAMFLIVASSLYIGYQSDFEVREAVQHHENGLTSDKLEPDSSFAVEVVFTTFFTIELIIRLVAWQGLFFTNDEWVWNVLDCILVISAIFDLLFLSLGVDLKYVRLLRLLRMLRGTRTVRVLRFFKTFRIMLVEFMGAMMPLMWACIFILIVTFCFAVCILQGVAVYINNPVNADTAQELIRFFDNLPKALLSLYMGATGGVSYIEMAVPLLDVAFLYGGLLITYMTLLMLVAFNVITATFVTELDDIMDDEKASETQEEMKKTRALIKEFTRIFDHMDDNGSGLISWQEWDDFKTKDEVTTFFKKLAISVAEMDEIFDVLDRDGTGAIELDEFVVGCLNIHNMAKPVNTDTVMRENHRILKKVENLQAAIHEDLKDGLDAITKQCAKAYSVKSPRGWTKTNEVSAIHSAQKVANKIAAPAPVAPPVQKRHKISKKPSNVTSGETE